MPAQAEPIEITQAEALHDLALFSIVASRGQWIPYRHLLYLAERIQHAVETPGSRLIIQIPPRHGKTELAAIYTPAWVLKRWPGKRIIYCTYGASLAYEKSRRCRQVFRELGWGARLSDESKAVESWNTENLIGGYVATGVDGPITGKGADVLIWDDPIKDQKEAASAYRRQTIFEYWQWTLSTRLQPGASVILIQTRWHHDDPAGRLAREGWEVVSLPAEAEECDPIGRQPGDALCPEMYDLDALSIKKKELGSHAYAALFGQRPVPRSGGMFKPEHFRYFERDGEDFVLIYPDGRTEKIRHHTVRKFQTVDVAATESERSDYTVVLTAVQSGENLLILDVHRERAETTKHESLLKRKELLWKPLFQAVERKTFGLNIIQNARKAGRPLKALEADQSKELRAEPASVHYENGLVWHLSGAHWVADFEKELCEFPRGSHDDQVDCIAYAVLLAREGIQDSWGALEYLKEQ